MLSTNWMIYILTGYSKNAQIMNFIDLQKICAYITRLPWTCHKTTMNMSQDYHEHVTRLPWTCNRTTGNPTEHFQRLYLGWHSVPEFILDIYACLYHEIGLHVMYANVSVQLNCTWTSCRLTYRITLSEWVDTLSTGAKMAESVNTPQSSANQPIFTPTHR